MAARLVLIAAFNVLLSVCLIGFTNAKRSEVFAITVASVFPVLYIAKANLHSFAAVQVVFVGTETG